MKRLKASAVVLLSLASVALTLAWVGTAVSPATAAALAARLEGAGSTFVNPLMQKWASEYQKAKGVEINYQPIGSGAGINKMTKEDVDFGCTDVAMTDAQLKAADNEGGAVVHIPLAMGAVVPAYNLEGVDTLKFSGKVLGDIYLGKIRKWNDAAIKALNPGVALPDLGISVVRRADASGTSAIFTDFLNKTNPDWEKVGVGVSVDWPIGGGEKGNDGVTNFVKNTKGALGYIELLYALENKVPYGDVVNKAGTAVRATPETVTAAAAGKDFPKDLRYTLTDSDGKTAYPISGTVFAVAYVKSKKAGAVADFLRWCTHEGQELCGGLHYARLPNELVAVVDEKLNTMK